MVRDFDLIRKIMLDVQSGPADQPQCTLHFDGEYDQATVDAHVSLLIDAGLLTGKVLRGSGRILHAVVTGMTWEGHDFIDAAKDETLWAKAKTNVLKPAAAITFEALLQWLKAEALKRLGVA